MDEGSFEIDVAPLDAWLARVGPVAVVDLETTGLPSESAARIVEIGALLLDPPLDSSRARVRSLATLVDPGIPIPPAIQRLTGIDDALVRGAPLLDEVRDAFRQALAGRAIVAHNASFERHFLGRWVGGELASARYFDTQDLLAITHPDAADLRLETFTRALLGTEERHRALSDAADTLGVMVHLAREAQRGAARLTGAHAALAAHAPDSPWLVLLEGAASSGAIEAGAAFVEIRWSDETPVPFDEDAIAAALRDGARGARHFDGYRVREEQVELALRFAATLAEGGRVLVEGGTGIGKSLAYLAAAIPFAMEGAARATATGTKMRPVVISTRTKLLQDQLLAKDIPAAARFLGYPNLRAVSIKGRANYACERRLASVLAESREAQLFPEQRLSYAVLAAAASIRPHGDLGAMPAAWLRRHPPLGELLRRSVAARAEQCSREQCAMHAACAFGRRRAALAQAHLIVANHDLLLRWPPDYPAFAHAIVDEAHELADVADEVYALSARPDEVLDRIDDVFGRPARAQSGGGESLLPGAKRRALRADAVAWRRGVQQDLVALGHALDSLAGEFGEVQVPEQRSDAFAAAAQSAEIAAARIEAVVRAIESHVEPEEESAALARNLIELRGSASALRLAFSGAEDSVAAFEGVEAPWDRWRLAVRLVSPALAFRENFLARLESFAGVSASLFVGGDAFAALGELGIEDPDEPRVERVSVPSPFPYEKHMRVAALAEGGDLVRDTADVLVDLARRLGGRTLGLFTSLRRMQDVAALVTERLREDGIEVLAPRRANDDPGALVARFRQGGAVLLGARKFWQGLDLAGDLLQAVVIEKLPFEVPTELRRRREIRLKRAGVDAFDRFALGKMLLNLKQMTGRLIRTETDRGLVVLVESRPEKRYFRRLDEALPPGSRVIVVDRSELGALLAEVGVVAPLPREF